MRGYLKMGVPGLILILVCPVLAQMGGGPVDSLFTNAVSYYQNGQYGQALQRLEALDRFYPDHHRLTASLLMQGKCLYRLREYMRALDVYQKLAAEHPKSRYRDDARYGMGTVYYQVQMYPQAVLHFLKVVEESPDRELQRKAAKLSGDIMDYRMNSVALQTLLEQVEGEREKAAVTIKLAQKEIEEQHFQTARRILLDFKNSYPRSSFLPRVESLLAETAVTGNAVKIGVILPLSGPLEEQGKRFLEGLEYAVRLANQEKPRVQLIVRDSESLMVKAILAAQELARNEEIVAIIGELESDMTAAIASVASERRCPLLAPTASENGLTEIGPLVFQLNADLESRARMLAEYAVNALGLKTFLILYPADRYGKAMSDGFKKYVELKGGEVLLEKWYFEGTENLNLQFEKIREFGIEKMIEDSLIVIVPEEELPEEGEVDTTGRLITDMTFAELVDSTELAVTAFDGIFMPVYGEDLPYIIPQYAAANIDARVFGGAPWDNPELLVENQKYIDQRYINGIVFLSDFYIDPSDYRYFQLRDAFRETVGRTPERMEVYGYDTASLIISVIDKRTRKDIGEALSGIREFEAVRGIMRFNEKRVNSSIRLLQFIGGRILPVR